MSEIDPLLLEIIVCPEDKGPVIHFPGEFFYNPRLQRAYPIVDGIPSMLVDSAKDVDDEQHERIMAAQQ